MSDQQVLNNYFKKNFPTSKMSSSSYETVYEYLDGLDDDAIIEEAKTTIFSPFGTGKSSPRMEVE